MVETMYCFVSDGNEDPSQGSKLVEFKLIRNGDDADAAGLTGGGPVCACCSCSMVAACAFSFFVTAWRTANRSASVGVRRLDALDSAGPSQESLESVLMLASVIFRD